MEKQELLSCTTGSVNVVHYGMVTKVDHHQGCEDCGIPPFRDGGRGQMEGNIGSLS